MLLAENRTFLLLLDDPSVLVNDDLSLDELSDEKDDIESVAMVGGVLTRTDIFLILPMLAIRRLFSFFNLQM